MGLLERFKEPSSWAGVGVLLGLFGVKIAPEGMELLAVAAAAVCGVLAFFLKEKAKPTA